MEIKIELNSLMPQKFASQVCIFINQNILIGELKIISLLITDQLVIRKLLSGKEEKNAFSTSLTFWWFENQ